MPDQHLPDEPDIGTAVHEMTDDGVAPSADERWETVLDELEQRVADVEAGHQSAPWQPPAGLGPIPDDLRGRAGLLVAAQGRAMAALRARQAEQRQVRTLAGKVQQATGHRHRGSYVDSAY